MSAAEIHTGPAPETSERTELATRDASGAGAPMMRRVDADGVVAMPSPLELIQFALERGVDGEQLEKLVGLHERMEERNAVRAFNSALAAFQRECPPIRKNKTSKITLKSGGSYSFTYAELDAIEAHIKPYLEKHELWYTFDGATDEKGVMFTGVCILAHAAGHSRQSKFTLPIANESAMSGQQKVGAAYSFAKRQTLAAVLGLNITDKEVPDDEVDPTTITEDQALVIEDLLTESGANRQKFLEWLDADSTLAIRAADYERAVATLKARVAKRQESAQ